jgi:hypothetical protein
VERSEGGRAYCVKCIAGRVQGANVRQITCGDQMLRLRLRMTETAWATSCPPYEKPRFGWGGAYCGVEIAAVACGSFAMTR